jgi:hypothetical protein
MRVIIHKTGSQWEPWIECAQRDIDSRDNRLISKTQYESGKFGWMHAPLLLWHETLTCPGCGGSCDASCWKIGGLGICQHEPEAEECDAS